jgi:hypothetical protein
MAQLTLVNIALILNVIAEGIGGGVLFGSPSLMPPPLGPKVAALQASGAVGAWVIKVALASTACLAFLSLIALVEPKPVPRSTILTIGLYHTLATYICVGQFTEEVAEGDQVGTFLHATVALMFGCCILGFGNPGPAQETTKTA